MTSPAVAKLLQGHSTFLQLMHPVQWPIGCVYARFADIPADHPGAPFECLGLDLAPGYASHVDTQFD